ncbi:heavy metal translocating P-type ATPase [Bacillus carboniphilus]|uniref:heavy metal translocating P-type ATPase n=1 Tax=Bacillus carboniphilus TaxID=86663 RepID=UPI001CFBFF78
MNEQNQINIHVTGMTCASCSNRIEKVLNKMDGVEANVNLTTEMASIRYPSQVKTGEIVGKINDLGYGVETEQVELEVYGMTCASCSTRIEKVLNKMEGIENATVNLTTETASCTVQKGVVTTSDIINKIEKLGYKAKIKQNQQEKVSNKEKEIKKQKVQLSLSILFSLPLLYTMVAHFPFLNIPMTEILMNPWVQFLFATPVQFWIGGQFYVGAYKALRNKSANMDVLVALGTSAAYFYSLVEGLRTIGNPQYTPHLYFETSAVLITLILVGKLFEALAKGRTTEALSKLLHLQAKEATVLKNGEERKVSIQEVMVEDIIIVKPGEKIPVDGVVLEGHSFIDEAMITGESIPVKKEAGDQVVGSTINKNGTLKMKATHVGEDTALSHIIRVVEEAQGSKAPIQRLSDVISGYFVPIVVVIAVLTFFTWFVIVTPGDIAQSLEVAIAVLVIACPCALGLATPTSIMVGSGLAAENGILFKGGEHLENTHKVDAIVFDKTGTITKGKPVVTDYQSENDEILSYLYTAEDASEHPLAEAIVDYAKEHNAQKVKQTNFEAIPGHGIKSEINNQVFLVGTRKLMSKYNINYSSYQESLSTFENQGKTAMLIALEGQVVGVIAVADTVKETATKAINQLQQNGIDVYMITGDNQKTAEAIAGQVGINHVFAEVLPEEKANHIKTLQEQGRKVAMVGDGINDAPALATADVGIAIGTGTDVAIDTADITIMGEDLSLIFKAIKISKKTMKNIRQNLFWALAYNSAGIPIAAIGLLAPWVAGAAMAFSSVSVVTNSLRLKRVKL